MTGQQVLLGLAELSFAKPQHRTGRRGAGREAASLGRRAEAPQSTPLDATPPTECSIWDAWSLPRSSRAALRDSPANRPPRGNHLPPRVLCRARIAGLFFFGRPPSRPFCHELGELDEIFAPLRHRFDFQQLEEPSPAGGCKSLTPSARTKRTSALFSGVTPGSSSGSTPRSNRRNHLERAAAECAWSFRKQ